MYLKTLPFIYSYCIEHNPYFYEKMKGENELEKKRGEGKRDSKTQKDGLIKVKSTGALTPTN